MNLASLRRQSSSNILRYMLCAFSLAFLIGAICAPDRAEIFTGFWRILSKPSLLTKDYFFLEIGSISGAMLNAGLVGSLCCALMHLPGATVAGGTLAGYFLTVGFSFFGLNLLNILPIMLGVFVYSLLKKQPFAKNINFAMFATALSPFVSEVLWRYPDAEPHGVTLLGLVLALAIGLVVGVAIPALCGQSALFHSGFNLYNAGPAAGFLALMIYAILYKALGIQAPAITATLGAGNALFCNVFAVACFLLCLVFGLILNGGFKGYGKLLLDSGFKVDFAAKYGVGATVINIGLYGLFILAYYNIVGATFTGPTFCVVWCMLAFGAAGSTPLNVLPILLGYFVGSLFGVNPINAQAIVVGACFASGLAPVSGQYGPIAGLIAGVLHYCLVTSVPAIHGGFNLYNGGFTSGLVAFVLVPVIAHFFRSRDQKTAAK